MPVSEITNSDSEGTSCTIPAGTRGNINASGMSSGARNIVSRNASENAFGNASGKMSDNTPGNISAGVGVSRGGVESMGFGRAVFAGRNGSSTAVAGGPFAGAGGDGWDEDGQNRCRALRETEAPRTSRVGKRGGFAASCLKEPSGSLKRARELEEAYKVALLEIGGVEDGDDEYGGGDPVIIERRRRLMQRFRELQATNMRLMEQRRAEEKRMSDRRLDARLLEGSDRGGVGRGSHTEIPNDAVVLEVQHGMGFWQFAVGRFQGYLFTPYLINSL